VRPVDVKAAQAQVDQAIAESMAGNPRIVQVLENAADALRQRQPLQPLPDLDLSLEVIQIHLEPFDRASDSTAANASSQTVRARVLISASLNQLTQEIKSIHSAIARLHP
jgi:hypothetical protein